MRIDTLFGVQTRDNRAGFEFLADSVSRAASGAPAKWGLTPYAEGARLNVGFCEAVTLFDGELRIIALKRALPARLPKSRVQVDSGYASSPGSVMVVLALAGAVADRALLNRLREAHEAALTVSAKRGFNAGARVGHSDGAVQLLGHFVNRTLPLPTFKRDKKVGERWEGALVRTQAARYERSRAARNACIEHFGEQCAGCDMLFEGKYGPDAAGLIHVHHLSPVSTRGARYQVDSRRDLIPVCPNCHAVIHAATPPHTIEAVRRMVRTFS